MADESVPPVAAAGITSRASTYSIEDSLERLTRLIAERNLTLFAHIDHSGEAARAGLVMQPAHVLIFGAPKGGTPLMVAAPLLALDLPLKVLVWQDGDGHVWVSYNSTAYLANRYALPEELTRNIAWVDTMVAAALQR